MGEKLRLRLRIEDLWLTNTGDDERLLLLSKWKPIKNEDQYYIPAGSGLTDYLFIPNLLNLEEWMGSVKVRLEESDEETSIWFIPTNVLQVGKKPWISNGRYVIDLDHMKYHMEIDHLAKIRVRLIGNKRRDVRSKEKIREKR